VEVFAYVLARDWNKFLVIQEGLLLGIIERIESAGVQIALPLQTVLADASAFNSGAGRVLIKAPAPARKPGDNGTKTEGLP